MDVQSRKLHHINEQCIIDMDYYNNMDDYNNEISHIASHGSHRLDTDVSSQPEQDGRPGSASTYTLEFRYSYGTLVNDSTQEMRELISIKCKDTYRKLYTLVNLSILLFILITQSAAVRCTQFRSLMLMLVMKITKIHTQC